MWGIRFSAYPGVRTLARERRTRGKAPPACPSQLRKLFRVLDELFSNAGQSDRYVAIPEEYADKERSGLTYEVKGGKQVHNIELK
jgi:hypothetical protein